MTTPKPCLDCSRVTTNGSRCPACAVAYETRRDQQRGTRTQRGYDNNWRRVVKQAIALQPWCSACGATDDLTGDHIVPLKAGGASVPSNVMVLCRSCNSRKGVKVVA